MKASEFVTEDEATKTRLDPKCWTGKKIGNPKTKVKGGVRVNNCVPAESVEESVLNELTPYEAGEADGLSGEPYENPYPEGSGSYAEFRQGWREGYNESKQELDEEFDLIESIIDDLAERNGVDAEVIWEDLESLTNDELYVFAVTTEPVMEDWQKANKKDRTAGMSQKAVNAYRRENPGSKLKTAVTTKPSKLKKGSKASKRRKSYCSRSRGQMKMHNISCAKTPDKAICAARRRWNCE
jgi:hypothetical protein